MRSPPSRRGIASFDRLVHQVEIYFSIIQRKVLTPNDFEDLAVLAAP